MNVPSYKILPIKLNNNQTCHVIPIEANYYPPPNYTRIFFEFSMYFNKDDIIAIFENETNNGQINLDTKAWSDEIFVQLGIDMSIQEINAGKPEDQSFVKKYNDILKEIASKFSEEYKREHLGNSGRKEIDKNESFFLIKSNFNKTAWTMLTNHYFNSLYQDLISNGIQPTYEFIGKKNNANLDKFKDCILSKLVKKVDPYYQYSTIVQDKFSDFYSFEDLCNKIKQKYIQSPDTTIEVIVKESLREMEKQRQQTIAESINTFYDSFAAKGLRIGYGKEYISNRKEFIDEVLKVDKINPLFHDRTLKIGDALLETTKNESFIDKKMTEQLCNFYATLLVDRNANFGLDIEDKETQRRINAIFGEIIEREQDNEIKDEFDMDSLPGLSEKEGFLHDYVDSDDLDYQSHEL